MIYDIIPLGFIIICLAVIIIIFTKRLPDLRTLDISSIPEEKESQIKKRIITQRLYRKTDELRVKLAPLFKKILKLFELLFKKIYLKIIELEKKYQKEEQKTAESRVVTQDNISQLFLQAEEQLKAKQFLEAEKTYLEIISQQEKNLKAYQGLGEVYLELKNDKQAIETFTFIEKYLKQQPELTPEEKHLLAISYYNLSVIYKNLSKFSRSIRCIKQSLELEPINPKYLDLMIEVCIIVKDKKTANECVKKLKESNPENVKISEFEARIKEL